MDFKSAFQLTPKWVRWVLLVLLVMGFVGLGLGLAADKYEWWGNLSFTPNIVTSLVSFGIGLPFAFFIVATVIDSRDNSVEEVRVDKLTRRAWQDFTTAVDEYPGQIYRLYYGYARTVVEGYTQAEARVYQLHSHPDRDVQFKKLLNDLADTIESSLNQLDGQQHSFDNRRWPAIQNSWNYLQNTIKARRLENDLAWYHARGEVDVDTAVRGPSPDEVLFVGVSVEEMVGPIMASVGQLPSCYRLIAANSYDTALAELGKKVTFPKLGGGVVDRWCENVTDGFYRWERLTKHARDIDPKTFRPRPATLTNPSP